MVSGGGDGAETDGRLDQDFLCFPLRPLKAKMRDFIHAHRDAHADDRCSLS